MPTHATTLPRLSSAPRPLAATLFLSVAFIGLEAISAHLRIPIPGTPVPFTLQAFFVLLSGAFLGPSVGATTQAAYVALGAAGLPMFAGGAGIAHLFGPTGGYLFGFVMAALSVGRLVRAGAGRSYLATFHAMLFAYVVILVMGSLYLSLFYGGDFMSGIVQGGVIFLAGAVVKAAAAAGVYRGVRRRRRAR